MRSLLVMILLAAGAAQADVEVTFRDGAPKDRFTITNVSDCTLGPLAVTLDLASSPTGLVFDTTDKGAGVEVFQPFELTSDPKLVKAVSEVSDGDQQLVLSLVGMAAKAQVSFTIDLDDTGGGREITVSGSEIAGARVLIRSGPKTIAASFDTRGVAQVPLSDCTAS